MTTADIFKAAAGAVLGGLLTWTAQALTLQGELRGLARSVERIEHRLDQMAPQMAPHQAQAKE